MKATNNLEISGPISYNDSTDPTEKSQLSNINDFLIQDIPNTLENFSNNLKTAQKTILENGLKELQAGSRYAHEKFWPSCPQNSFA